MLNILLVLVSVSNVNVKIVHPYEGMAWFSSPPRHPQRVDTIYREDFENGPGGWTSQDSTAYPYRGWHSDTFQAYGGTGKSWWLGDPSINGYLNHWYLTLDSPEINVPGTGTPTLTFQQNRAMEGFEGRFPAGYDGWDGCNVRVSTDGGTTWTVIRPTEPPYNSTSMYSFGWEHGEGPGIPGWGGSSSGWEQASFDLSAYKGQKIKIRWAFASDPAFCTTDEPGLFGWQIDDIKVGTAFTNNGEDTTGFTPTALGGDLWHIATAPDAPTPTHVADCSNQQGSYNAGMRNFYTSPPIQLLETDEQINFDFMVRGGMADPGDPDSLPYLDFMYVQISPDDGKHWYAVSNPTGDPTGTNYVYTFDTTDIGSFRSFNDISRGAGFLFIPEYAGKNIRFRIGLQSDVDTPHGIGIKFDHFVVYRERQGIEEHENLLTSPMTFSLCPSHFNTSTTIRYQLPKPGRATIAIYNCAGERIKTLIDNSQPAGVYSVKLNGKELATGVYFLRLDFEGRALAQKLVLLH